MKKNKTNCTNGLVMCEAGLSHRPREASAFQLFFYFQNTESCEYIPKSCCSNVKSYSMFIFSFACLNFPFCFKYFIHKVTGCGGVVG